MLVIALQDSVIAKACKAFWGCLLQLGWLLCWERTRANPRASPARMQSFGSYSGVTEMWNWPKYHISWWNNLCFVFFGSPEEAVALDGDGERLRGGYEGQGRFLVLALFPYSCLGICYGWCQIWTWPSVTILFSSGSSLFCSKNNEIWGV